MDLIALSRRAALPLVNRALWRIWSSTYQSYPCAPGRTPALGICSRYGLGKLRHFETHIFWVHEEIRLGAFELRRVKCDVKRAGLSAISCRERLHSLVGLFGCVYRDGRSASLLCFYPFLRAVASSYRSLWREAELGDDEAFLADMHEL